MLYLQRKDNFVDVFQSWLPKVEVESGYSMKILRADSGGEFISVKLIFFCKKLGITIKYVVSYMYKDNKLAEQKWRIIVTMKDAILINSSLLNGF